MQKARSTKQEADTSSKLQVASDNTMTSCKKQEADTSSKLQVASDNAMTSCKKQEANSRN